MKFWSDTFDPIEKKVLKSDLINNEDFASLVCDLDIVPIKDFIPCRHVPKGGGCDWGATRHPQLLADQKAPPARRFTSCPPPPRFLDFGTRLP